MSTFIHPAYRLRFLFAALLIAGLAWAFWTGSRYPALDEKAMMSGAIQLEDALSFEAKFPITADMGLPERLFWSTLNWINTNKKGMTFGVLFAAAFLTAAAYLRTRSFRGGFANSALGLIIGAPLGVCVNCAAPIAKGMYSAGMRAETTLSAMIASPTLNIVVLTMLFSIMPVYMALTKIALSLLIILVLVPLICRLLPRVEIAPQTPAASARQTPWSAPELEAGAPPEGVAGALAGVVLSYLRNLWYIIRLTVPLMLLAGFLGTLVAVFLPGDLIMGLPFSVWVLVGVALVGVFLPVPIAFDVVVTGALLASGLGHGYVMALLFTLGTFSIYSFFIVAGSVGARAAWLLGGAVMALGVLAGAGAHLWHGYQTERALEMLLGARSEAPAPGRGAAMAAGADPETWPETWTVTSADAARITVMPVPHAPRSPAAATGFTRMEAWETGIDKPLEFSMRDMWPPFWEGRSVASADFDRDGDLDIAVASTEAGLYLYLNDGHGTFARAEAALGKLADAPVFNAMPADIDNDGWPDLFLATYGQGNYLLRNNAGRFDLPPEPVPNRADTPLSLALAAADPDRDGDLDIALGNWAAGWYRRVPGEESRNRILWNEGGDLGARHTDLPGIPGETLSVLFTDFDGDGLQDLIVGNDFEVPDYFYRGDGAGGFAAITHADGLIPHITTTTMAVKTGDLTGDGAPEIYLAQIAGRSSGVSERLKMQPLELYCDAIGRDADRARCAANMAIKRWYRAGNSFDPSYAHKCRELTGRAALECRAMLVKDLAIQQHDPAICALIPADQPIPRAYCDMHFKPVRAITGAEAAAALPQILRSNVLLERDGAGWADTAGARGLEIGGWSWDTKLADFDLDGWLDVYVVNGTWVPNEVSPSNLFFHNRGDGTFEEASGPFGLEDYLMTAAATAFDADNDGDPDLLSHPVNGPLAFFRNNAQGRAIGFALEDHAGNRDGIGAVVTITGVDGRRQSRELQLGGGFMSFDAPRALFGLGDAAAVQEARIRWPDGAETVIRGPLGAGALYRVRRD